MVPTSIQVPSTQPADVQSVSMYLTVLMQQLQQWIGLASKLLNGFGDYQIGINDNGELTATAKNGVVTVLARPFDNTVP